jgi:hypothetical protein
LTMEASVIHVLKGCAKEGSLVVVGQFLER